MIGYQRRSNMGKSIIFVVGSILSLQQTIWAAPYLIGNSPAGFAGNFIATLEHIYYCDQMSFMPAVYWGKDSLYYDPHGYQGTHNAWEYYFDPVSSLVPSHDPGKPCGLPAEYATLFHPGKVSSESRKIAFQTIQKYINLKKEVLNKIDSFYEKNIKNKDTIAIHLRGTDKYLETRPVKPEYLFEVALGSSTPKTQFLICTDEEKLLKQAKEYLKNYKIITYNSIRSTNGNPIHINAPQSSKRTLGEDVLIEMVLMSKCKLLVHTRSNVSTVPLFFNPRMDHIRLGKGGRTVAIES